jgi:predicted DNA-binding antitoxin AbrB/MazE fold protein
MTTETETVEAVYEHGVFRLTKPADLKLTEGQKVRLVVAPLDKPDILALAEQVYEGLSDDEIEAIEEHYRRRADFFGYRRNSPHRPPLR